MSRSKATEAAVRAFAKHPYLSAALICLLLDPFFFGSVRNIPIGALLLECIGVVAVSAVLGYSRLRKGSIGKKQFLLFMVCVSGAVLFGAHLYAQSERKAMWHFVGGCAAIMLLYYLADMKKYRKQVNAFTIMALGFMLKLYYVLVTSVYTRQNDVYTFDGVSGHAGYIEYLVNEHHICDFDPRMRWQYVHPPLHHAISAVWVTISEKIMMTGRDPARESIQMLTLFYSMCIIISAYKILRYFGMKGNALYVPLAVVSFHPAYVLFSGAINNDVLSVALAMGAVVCTLEWYSDPTFGKIFKIAVCIGCAMMTKVAAATVAPPVALVFLVVFIRNFKEKGKELFWQYFAFGLVCVPLGLWFGIRNFLRWEIPLTYVSKMSEDCEQYLGNTPFMQRVTDFSAYQLSSPYESWAKVSEDGTVIGYNEFNPLITLMKNTLFGEEINAGCFSSDVITLFAWGLFWVNVVIAGTALIAMLYHIFRKPSMPKFFIGAFYAMLMGSFYKAAADYPFTCTMNFRYIAPTVITGAVFLGLMLKGCDKEKPAGKAVGIVSGVTACLFAGFSVLVYTALV